MSYEGYNGTIDIEDDVLVIARDGMVAKAAFGKVPPRRLPLQALHGVRHKPASRLGNGWLQLLLGGVNKPEPTAGTAAGDPDVVLFTYGKRQQFDDLYKWLDSVVERNRELGLDPSQYDYDTSASRLQRVQERSGTLAGRIAEVREAHQATVAGDAADSLFRGTSHDPGRNAVVTLYPDRLERIKEAKLTSFSRANQDVEVTPVRAVSSVQAKKDGLWTKVTVYASGNNIDFRFAHKEAQQFRDALMALVLQPSSPPAAPAPTPAAAPDLADQLMKLAALRDSGILTEDEFATQKARLLA